MTAFITPCCENLLDRVRLGLCALCLLVLPALAQAEGNSVRHAELVPVAEGYVVNAQIELELGPRLIEALLRGVSLHFVLEFQLERPRWYWVNREIVQRSIDYRLSYHTITRSYRLSIGGLHQTFDSLDAALRTMQRVSNWEVIALDALETGVSYDAALRMRHDTSRLPRPFQVTAIGSRDWSVATDWYRWRVMTEDTP